MKRIALLVLASLFSVIMYAQTTVTGVVTGIDDEQPVPFANILIKGTTQGTFTDANGAYSINCNQDAVLIVSAIGYSTQEVVVGGRTVINIGLKTDSNLLEETIVVAYGTAKKGTFTGAASVVKQDAIKDVPAASFENALNGKVAGMQITTTSGQAGSAPSIRIRGIGSMNASNEPLYVIDGVPAISGGTGQMGDYIYTSNNVMASMNPSDIESITVLKDAAASALYGSRAANGVILITTKSGKEGKTKVNFKASVALTPSWATDNYEVAGVQENVDMMYMVLHDYQTSDGESDAYANSYSLRQLNSRWNRFGYDFTTDGTGVYEHVKITDRTDGLYTRNGEFFDWDKAYFRTAVYQTYDLSVGGGNDKTKYYTSFSYTKEQGRVYVNNFDRFAGRINLQQRVNKYIDVTTNASVSKTSKSGYNDTRSTTDNYFMQTRNLLWGTYWPDDYKTGLPWTDRYQSLAQNLLYYNDYQNNWSKTFKVTINETVNVNLTEWLNVKSIFSYDRTETKDHLYYSPIHFKGANDNGSVTDMSTLYEKTVSSTTVNFNKSFGKHNVSVLAGIEAERNKTSYTRASGTNFPSSSLETVSVAGKLDAAGYWWGHNMVSVLSRAEYNYDNKYYISGSYRRDGSSRLGEDSRWGNFWSVAGSWRISNEKFMENIKWLSNLRLRASYGVNGTLPSSNYGWRSLAGYSYKYQTEPGGALINAADANLSWEKSYTYNVALEFGLFDNRLTGTVEYFSRDSKDLLQNVPISTVTGMSSTLKNIGEINNHGVEIELAGDIIKTQDWRWSASINASFLRNKVTTLYGGQDIIWYDPTGSDDRAKYIYREGQPVLSFYGYEWAGIDPSNGAQMYYSNNENADKVIDGRNVVYDFNDADDVIIGNATPKVYGGINTDVEWKGISLGLNFIYKIGGHIFDGAERDVADDGYYWNRTRSQYYYDNMWTPSNPNGTQPKIRGIDLTDAIQESSRHIYNASFLRLKTITLGYNFPTELVKKVGLGSARVYFSGSNLLTFSKYKNADPEVNEYGTRGWETPIGKTYTFGIELSF